MDTITSQVEDSSLHRSSTTTKTEVYTPIIGSPTMIEDKTRVLNATSHQHQHRYSKEKTCFEAQEDSDNPLKPRQSILEPSLPSPKKLSTNSQSIYSLSNNSLMIHSKDKMSSMKDWLSVIRSIQVERSTRRIPTDSWDSPPHQKPTPTTSLILSTSSIQHPSSSAVIHNEHKSIVLEKIQLLKLSDLAPFFYTSPGHDTLLLTKSKDLIISTQFKDKLHNHSRRYRLVIRGNSTHRLEMSELSNHMVMEFNDIAKSIHSSSMESIFSVKDYTHSSPHLISSQHISKSYSVYKLPSTLHKCYLRIYHMVEIIRSRLPRIILYLSVSSAHKILNTMDHHQDHNNSKNKIECKCMLMSNAPLPDFQVQWYDQTKLKYSLQSGKLSLSGPTISPYKYSTENTLDWTEIADEVQKSYLLVAQEAMRRCLEESKRKREESPIVIVDRDDQSYGS